MALKTPTTIPQSRSLLVDELANGTIYIGAAKPGSATSAAVWQIRQLLPSGTVSLIRYANGNDKYTNIWDNRASLSYS